MESEKPTDPHVNMITQDDILSYMVGAIQRIESQLASEEPPPWAGKLFLDLTNRIVSLEAEVQKIKNTCALRHGNGSQLKLL